MKRTFIFLTARRHSNSDDREKIMVNLDKITHIYQGSGFSTIRLGQISFQVEESQKAISAMLEGL